MCTSGCVLTGTVQSIMGRFVVDIKYIDKCRSGVF